jgi:hypothetical protein
VLKDLNRERLRFLFKEALGREQIKRFLDIRKASLVMHGAQYQRRSRGGEADIAFLLNLPDKCLPTITTWVTDELGSDVPFVPEALIAQFCAVENGGAQLSAADAKTFAQMGLKYLLRPNAPAAWLSFLRTPISGSKSEAPDETVDTREEAEEALSTGEPEMATVTDVLTRLKADDAEGAMAILNRLTASPLVSELTDLVRLHRTRSRPTVPGAREPRELESLPALPAERIPVLLRRTRQSAPNQPVFIDIEGVFLEGSIYKLTDSQALELFKHRQFVIGFPGTRLPSVGEVAFWFVEEYPTDKPIKFRLKKPATPLHIVISIDANFKDYDEVRTAILSARIEPWMKVVFKLRGGEYLHLAADTVGGVRTAVDTPMRYFRSLPCWEYLGMELFVGTLPAPDGEYDCADLSHTIGRILKESDERQQLRLTKAQIGAFVESLRASHSGLTAQRIDRLALEFDRYIEEGTRLQDISAHVLTSSAASDLIRAAKEEAVATIRKENHRLRDEQSRLQRELTELRSRRDALSAEMKQIASEVRTSVKRAFDRAKEAGSKSLGEVAVMAALLEHTVDPRRASPSPSEECRIDTVERAADARALLVRVGMGVLEAKALAVAAPLICGAGLPILVQGPRAGQVAQALGCCVTPDRCSVWTVPIGLVDSGAMRVVLEQTDTSGSLVVRNCNLSAFDSYASLLMDRVLQSAVEGNERAVIFAAARGPAALPLDEDLLALAVIVDTAARFAADPEAAAVIELLRDDRSSAKIRSAALLKVFAKLGDHPDHLELVKVLQAQPGVTAAS